MPGLNLQVAQFLGMGSRTIKEDFIWIREFSSPIEFAEAFKAWVDRYNNDYPHSSLKYQIPCELEKEQLLLDTKIYLD
jgi:transposase InsO family protein